MRQSRIGEFELIRCLRRATAISHSVQAAVLAGIGDDAAILKLRPGRVILATTDLLAERIHFDLAFTSYRQLGYKAAMANLSDIAAMGGIPRFLLIALALTPRETFRDVKAMYEGIRAACNPAGVAVVGGDTSASRTDLFLAVTALGDAAPRDALRRSGARAGDRLYVTGTLGDAKAGLELLQMRRRTNSYLITRHLTPTARLKEARHLADSRLASAAIDVSDGLAGDIRHICEESKVGCLIDARKVPLSPQLLTYARTRKRDPIAYALSGGEDYELLFTVPPAKVARVDSLIRRRLLRATPIGVITPRRQGLRLIGADGSARPLTARGYEHCL
jgi:thiamine-monophosphate kinase